MKILITGICGFAGASSRIPAGAQRSVSICGIDNLDAPGVGDQSHALRALGVKFIHGDIRIGQRLRALPDVDWVIDAAANPSVLAGRRGQTSSRQLFEHNLAASSTCWNTARRIEPA